jgi:hypothetical protein
VTWTGAHQVWCLWTLLALNGCAQVGTTYTPARAAYAGGARQIVELAVVAYEDDMQALKAAGGVVLGQMAAAGNGFARQDDVRDRVRRDAADRGATHVVFAASYEEEDRTPVQYNTQCKDGRCLTTSSGGDRFYRPHAAYVLIRVPRKNWARLPDALLVEPLPSQSPAALEGGGTGLAGLLGLRGGEPSRRQKRVPIEEMEQVERWETSPSKEARRSNADRSRTIRRDCYARAKVEFQEAELDGKDDQSAAERADVSGASFGDAFAEMKSRDAADRERVASEAAPRERALRWYRQCVLRESKARTSSTP